MVSFAKLIRKARDPRLLLGMVLVIGGGTAGALLMSKPDSVLVPQATTDVAAGDTLDKNNFTLIQMPRDIAHSYVHGLDFAPGSITQRSLSAGEFLPENAVGKKNVGIDIAVPVAVPQSSALKPGTTINVWRVPRDKDAHSEIIARDAIFVGVEERKVIADGKKFVNIRVNSGGVANIVEALGRGDGFVVVGSGS